MKNVTYTQSAQAYDKLKNNLILAEGIKLKVYQDTKGIMTIGVGRNLEGAGISKDEAMLMLDNDIQRVLTEANKIPYFSSLDQARQLIILEMLFNLGYEGLMNFKNMLSAIKQENWNKAADEMLNSQWAKQVKQRAWRLARSMRVGSDI